MSRKYTPKYKVGDILKTSRWNNPSLFLEEEIKKVSIKHYHMTVVECSRKINFGEVYKVPIKEVDRPRSPIITVLLYSRSLKRDFDNE